MDRFLKEGLTFDDVLLVPRYSDFLPSEADVSAFLTRRIRLNIPLISAAMDTVTESRMAIAMAMLGGIGVIHKNLAPEVQAEKVSAVKQYLNGLIRHPVTFRDSQTVEEIQAIRREKGYTFSGFPIVDDRGRVVGMLTGRDVRYVGKASVKVSTIMTRELVKASAATSLEQAYQIMMKHKVGKLPLIDRQGKLAGLYSFTDVRNLVENTEPLYNRDGHYRLRVAAAVSGGTGDHERAEMLADKGVDVMVVDSAHGHSKGIIEMVKWIVKRFPQIDVIAGNIATGEAALALAKAGAHAVKVGIGPGSICTTRVVCGVGVPQISAVYAAAAALKGSIPVISDGGIRNSGDVPKAIVAGADAVMLGSVLAATDESPGEKIIHEGRNYVVYRGMGSLAAMCAAKGSRERYQQTSSDPDDLVPQGIEGIVPYAGSVRKVMTQFCGGLRSSLGYCGCKTLPALQKNGIMVRVSSAGVREAHPHDVKIMREAPNYRS
ncbi:MAG: IMP dehydrogenase [Kiritimatiellaeota bacterium]|nr:IMP dehydrogenase [Kiritimatiellota bacterium]